MPVKISKKSCMTTIVFPDGIIELIHEYCKKTGVSFSAFVRNATIRRLEELSLISSQIKGAKSEKTD